MELLFTIIAFTFGLIIGSFLNVVIYRYNTKKSLGGRSACMSCQGVLGVIELIPLFSYLGLRGRCRNCKTKISIQYPLVEFTTGLVFALLFLKFQNIFAMDPVQFSLTYVYYAALFSLLIVISVYDLKHKIIPDRLVIIFGLLAFAGIFFFGGLGSNFGFNPHMPGIFGFLSGVLIALPFALFWLVSRGAWMGLGDAKLAIGLGWMLGLSKALSALVVAFWSGAIIGIFLILSSKKYGMKTEIPFAPFLVVGAFLAFIFELHLFTAF